MMNSFEEKKKLKESTLDDDEKFNRRSHWNEKGFVWYRTGNLFDELLKKSQSS